MPFVYAQEPSQAPNSNTLTVQYPAIQDIHARDFDHYFLELLTLALEKSNTKYSLSPVKLPVMVESRGDRFLQHNPNMVFWLNSNSAREQRLTPIKIPLFKGLIGWRALFIRKEDQPLFSSITTKEGLAQYIAGQGHDWPDTEIFRLNNMKITTSPDWAGLFKMLSIKRIDYFPRSFIETEREIRLFPELNLHVENSLALHYPAAYYFFVNNKNKPLAKAIQTGLDRAIDDGDFDIVFNKYFSSILSKAKINQRRIIKMDATQAFPTHIKKYWYQATGK